jgi:hypothetical protein
LFVKELSNTSGNKLEPNNKADKIQIISIIIIPNAEVDLSLKNPPGYVEIAIVTAIINNINPILP